MWHFVRHGESVANAERWLAGHVDAPLTEAGRAQARAMAANVRRLPVARVLTSDLCRASETAELLRGGQPWPLTRLATLRERHLGSWERVSRDTLDAGAPELMRFDLGPPGGEAPREVALRFTETFASLPEVDGDTLVVAHGLALKTVVGLLDGLPRETMLTSVWGNVHLESRSVSPSTWAQLAESLRSPG